MKKTDYKAEKFAFRLKEARDYVERERRVPDRAVKFSDGTCMLDWFRNYREHTDVRELHARAAECKKLGAEFCRCKRSEAIIEAERAKILWAVTEGGGQMTV
ncbi:hypothetical protein FACS1894208_00340 [Clostridia bacterium]|nr:hypothetical protein FACS1894208_00340 [Clostridia bacterium]